MTDTELATTEVAQEKVNRGSFVRFTIRQRIEHIVLMLSFTVLSITGLAQRYSDTGWGEWTVLTLGGIEYTRLIHRAFAVLFIIGAIYHLGYVAHSFFIRHRKLSMVPTLKDFCDVVSALKYAFGLTDKPPQFARYDYRQKFEYWGLIFGSMVIIVTGIFLAFPVAATRILPGQVVAAAVELHGFEATLAVLTITIWHLYDVIFRPGIFPADTSIFTGKISVKRMIEEHPLEYAELQSKLDGCEPGAVTPEKIDSRDLSEVKQNE